MLDAPLRALIFDSWFDPYRGVIILARIVDGKMAMGQKIKLWSNGEQFDVEGLGYQSPKAIPLPELAAGEVGYIYANIKNVADAKVGDTITDADKSGRRSRCPASKRSSRWCSRACIRWNRTSTACCATRSKNFV